MVAEDQFETYIKQFEQEQQELNEELEYDDVPIYEDPYLASAIEFMYSEDTEEDFNTMDRK